MPNITAELPRALIEASKAELHATGAIPRPQVHMLAEDMEHSYIGFVICRMFYRGQDAATAIGDLGILPSVMKMTRLMILWENLDLSTALDQVTGPSPRALMLVDAQLSRHTLHKHLFDPVPTGQVVDGVATVSLRWETPQRSENAPLPDPITRLLRTWRELREDDIQQTAIALQRSGYELNWATPTT
ncbi:hypothetical protein E1264_12890 [Actinomadura sp. KC216]|uniref:hypothetical protein n=1 Tax=Actinomadura sp. KC216 TaxID=2530370 RepID=UPI00104F0817|nr:hypothetical protein [Actinomadura sp. KC216]TDB88012.1 hypothetical protein E1264_12890 [Actinomadura sp. KC216]